MKKRQKLSDKKEIVVDNGAYYEVAERKRMEKPQFSEAQVQELLQKQRK